MTAHLSPEDRDELRRLLSEANSGAMGMALRVARVEAIVAARVADAWDEGFNAGERDVFEHEHSGDWDSECIRNPYRNP